jgi:hypothetical protein
MNLSDFKKLLSQVVVRVATLFEFQVGQDIASIKNEYNTALFWAMSEYLDAIEGSVVKFRNEFRRAVNDAFTLAFIAGLVDGGGSEPINDEDQDWLNGRIEQEIDFADSLFQTLKGLRQEGLTKEERVDVASQHADNYTASLDGVYAEAKLRADMGVMLTFDGEDGAESCADCQRLKGQRHRAKWWISRDLIPRPGNPNLECKGWRCQHALFDDDGNIYSAPE